MALETLTTHLAGCGSKFELHCCGFVAAHLNSITSQTQARIRHIYGATVVIMRGNEVNKP